ncbi:hypothetical protein [Hymenobacter arizonensis]|uniref:Uncharacterized protein n=1 Tax=Hymenobacter arizonensis TaxID=1227077 RepID=A0A1I5ZPQ2_HYMAR|nr:hypothetical protein [Hymenobacter arizonensis]SFQ58464.1 hypothetical protein SAMN04515668_3104 [Hymenobacter arizonensis]
MSLVKTSGIISQHEFEQYAAEWTRLTHSANGAELQEVFQASKNKLIQGVDFPLTDVIQLLSTVGAHHIKARFIINNDSSAAKPYFTLALLATDRLGARLSSYYSTNELVEKEITDADGMNVADILARKWLQQWAALKKVSPALFDTTYGPLRGYTFDLKDFMKPLSELKKASPAQLEQASLRISFGLHEFYRSTGPDTDAKVHSFGLVVHLANLGNANPAGANLEEFSPFYDVSAPCPPTC